MKSVSLRTRLICMAMVVLVAASFSAGCNQKKAAIAMKDTADALEAVQNGFETAHKDGFISDADYQQAQKWLGDISQGGGDITGALKAGDKQTALGKFDTVFALVDQLNTDGVAHIKNTDRQLTVKALIVAFRGLLTTSRAFAQ